MKARLSKHIIPIAIVLIAVLAFAGSISGSLAWWTYSTFVAVSYQGTSVTTALQLQAGLKLKNFSNSKVTGLEAVGLYEDEDLAYTDGTGSYRYVFSKRAGLDAEAIGAYLTAEGNHATTQLSPVTSSQYADEGTFTLRKSPLVNKNYSLDEEADTLSYVEMTLVFRVESKNDNEYLASQPIWVTDFLAEASALNPGSHIGDAIRVHFDNGITNFIVNPSDHDTDATKTHRVFGVLNLEPDDVYYDIDEENYETIYGEVTYDKASLPWITAGSDIDGSSSNINEVSSTAEYTTFYAKHKAGTKYLANYSAFSTAGGNGLAEYRPFGAINPTAKDAYGNYTETSKAVCTTSSDARRLAELKTTIWLEGWDHAVIDQVISHSFNLGFTFSINMVNQS